MTKVVDFGTVNNFCKAHKMNYYEISIKSLESVKRFFFEYGAAMYESIKGKK
jgi:hypothetical protein